MENSLISWCDHTQNFWIGCTAVSPGCLNCYADTLDKNRFSKTLGTGTQDAPIRHWGRGAPRHRTSISIWNNPLKWDSIAKAGHFVEVTLRGTVLYRGDIRKVRSHPVKHAAVVHALKDSDTLVTKVRPRVFCSSLSDILDTEVDPKMLAEALDVIRRCDGIDWLLLTKRPELWGPRISAVHRLNFDATTMTNETPLGIWLARWATGLAELIPKNIWFGTTVEDHPRAVERIPALLEIPARVHFLSGEPLLGPVNLEPWLRIQRDFATTADFPRIDWVIVGGESGPDARPMHPAWARSLRDQCAAAGIAFHFKQWGEWMPGCQYQSGDRERLHEKAQHTFDADNHSWWVGKSASGRLLDGIEHNAFPVVEGRR